ncbi:MAG: type IV toxin-antitoxin system AbiEi family antitoxin domain-containing protein [Deltaproteobacteria bacterium]|nr:type IV toxin-antitoxin system AbiEi family antitoxin domain-containing protein [Deltaproteobacteria bacterium]
MKAADNRFDRAETAFRRAGGIMKYSDAVRLRIHPETLAGLLAEGRIERLARGVYRLTDLPPPRMPDLAVVAARVPGGVICLISALSFHGLTTQIPGAVHLAVLRGSRIPRLDHPPIRVFRFSASAFGIGVVQHAIDGVNVRIFDAEKTLVDCFKFRNAIGLDVALEALKLYRERKKPRVKKLLEYARTCRMERVMTPYLDAVL